MHTPLPYRRFRPSAAALALAACAVLLPPAHGQTVSMSGSLGNKALLVIDGTPRTVAVGSTVGGVTVVSVSSSETVVQIGGKRVTLPLGGAQVNLGGSSGGSDQGGKIVLSASSGGHFFTDGSINGRTVRFIVDTGATSIAMSETEAQRIGLDFSKGTVGRIRTANGDVPAHRVKLDSVRVGEVTVYNVDAVVVPAPMETVLLGNSFPSRFTMKQEADVMVLQRRY